MHIYSFQAAARASTDQQAKQRDIPQYFRWQTEPLYREVHQQHNISRYRLSWNIE